ncbi:MAG: SDR family oxidoreductase [Acidimicrobiales bacterium]
MRIENAACVVTGASSGIGEAAARLLTARGARVALLARRTERLTALATQLPGSVPLPTDVTDDAQLRAAVARAVDVFGRVDVLVNDAGQGLHVPLEQLDPGDLRAVFDLNVVAPLVAMRAVLPDMRERGTGSIVNVSSLTSLRAFAGLGGYAATKAALNVLSRVARTEFAPAGIAVSLVYPGVTATEFHDHLRAGHLVSRGEPVRAAPPEWAAAAVVFAIESGEAHVLVADPPRALDLGDEESLADLLARTSRGSGFS